MAKRVAKQMEPEQQEETLEEVQAKALHGLLLAKNTATKLFGGEPAPEVVFELFDYLATDADTEAQATEDITKAHEAAVELFGKSASDTTFAMFHFLFIKPFEETGEDEEEE